MRRWAAAALGLLLLLAARDAVAQVGWHFVGQNRMLMVQGQVSEALHQDFMLHVGQGGFREVWLNSPGGNIHAGYRIAAEIRRRGLATRVPRGATCVSACVDLLLAGVLRFVDDEFSVGIHPGSAASFDRCREELRRTAPRLTDMKQIQEICLRRSEQAGSEMTAEWVQYVMTMGASSDLVRAASYLPPFCMYYLSVREMALFNITNTVPRPPGQWDGLDPARARLDNSPCPRQFLRLGR